MINALSRDGLLRCVLQRYGYKSRKLYFLHLELNTNLHAVHNILINLNAFINYNNSLRNPHKNFPIIPIGGLWCVTFSFRCILQHGRQLLENYRSLVEELTQEDLDHLAHARSCSVSNFIIMFIYIILLADPTDVVLSTRL